MSTLETETLYADPEDFDEAVNVAVARLRAGDVVGLLPSCGRGVKPGERVQLDIPRVLRLEGWATAAPAPRRWRQSNERKAILTGN